MDIDGGCLLGIVVLVLITLIFGIAAYRNRQQSYYTPYVDQNRSTSCSACSGRSKLRRGDVRDSDVRSFDARNNAADRAADARDDAADRAAYAANDAADVVSKTQPEKFGGLLTPFRKLSENFSVKLPPQLAALTQGADPKITITDSALPPGVGGVRRNLLPQQRSEKAEPSKLEDDITKGEADMYGGDDADTTDYASYIANKVVDDKTRANHGRWVSEMKPWSKVAVAVDNMDEAIVEGISFVGFSRPSWTGMKFSGQGLTETEIDPATAHPVGNKPFRFSRSNRS